MNPYQHAARSRKALKLTLALRKHGISKIRHIEHEQLTSSTDAELAERLEQINRKADAMCGLFRCKVVPREYRLIRSEMYCRAMGIESKPNVTYTGKEV